MNKIFFLAILLAFSSCTIAPNRMFKTPKDYTFAKDTVHASKGPYIIQPNDRIEMHIYSNDGFKLIDITQSNTTQSNSTTQGFVYKVNEDGELKLPIINLVPVAGKNIRQAEDTLERLYAKYYQDPYIILKVTSRQALVFLGDGGRGNVVHLENDHTTLFEALALSGGLTDFSKAKVVKIIRGDISNPQVFLADISSVEALKNSELEVFPNDIIYVDSGSGFRKFLTSEFLPYLSVLTSLLVLLAYFKN